MKTFLREYGFLVLAAFAMALVLFFTTDRFVEIVEVQATVIGTTQREHRTGESHGIPYKRDAPLTDHAVIRLANGAVAEGPSWGPCKVGSVYPAQVRIGWITGHVMVFDIPCG